MKQKKFMLEFSDSDRAFIEEYKRFMGIKYNEEITSHMITLLKIELEGYKKRTEGFNTLDDFIQAHKKQEKKP